MLGAILGDIVGSPYEGRPHKSKEFPLLGPASRFTDDTVLTVAVAHAILTGTDYSHALKEIGRRYPDAGYGSSFRNWLGSASGEPYGSWGNGSAMRVSPVGWAFGAEEEVLREAERSAVVTHDHPEGIKGAQAVALAVFLARNGSSKAEISERVTASFGYDLTSTPDEIRPHYSFDVSCQGSVPQSIVCFLHSDSVEDAIRTAVSLGGDADTMACIAGAIAHAFYGDIEPELLEGALELLPGDLREVVDEFSSRYVAKP